MWDEDYDEWNAPSLHGIKILQEISSNRMSQATLLGLCSDNIVTILQPSSTIECISCCGSYVDVSYNTGNYIPYVNIPISGSVIISGAVQSVSPNSIAVTIGDSKFYTPGDRVYFNTFATGPSVNLYIVADNQFTFSYTISQLR